MIKLSEKISVMGFFELRVYRGSILIDTFADHNIIVDNALHQISGCVVGDAERFITHIAFGTNGSEASRSDTVITNRYARPINGYTYPENGKVSISWELPASENNGMAILEFGLLCADGSLFARRARNNVIQKDSDISLEGIWTIRFIRGTENG